MVAEASPRRYARSAKSANQKAWSLRCFIIACSAIGINIGHFAFAETYSQFDLGGGRWTVPWAYVQKEVLPLKGPHAVTLQFELPNFSPVNPRDFVGVTPGDALPVLSITMTDDPNVPSGQPLLDSLMSKVQTNCVWCVGNSSLGGKHYSNYALNGPRPGHLDNGAPFALYVDTVSQGDWFAVCYFNPILAPLPCERTIKISQSVTVTFKFPKEYMSEAFRLDAQVRALMQMFRLPDGDQSRPQAIAAAFRPPTCWSPAPGSPEAQTILLQVGPELWHIPSGYAEPFGVNQTIHSAVNGFDIFLKLPELRPLGPNDPSPFLIHGQGQYIDISISFQPVSGLPKMDIRPDGMVVPPEFWDEEYLGRDPFIKYHEFNSTGLGPILPEISQRYLVAESKVASAEIFPPQEFICGIFSPDQSPECDLTVNEPLSQTDPKEPGAGYIIDYSFSRDYYSQIQTISWCVGKFFETISGQFVRDTDVDR